MMSDPRDRVVVRSPWCRVVCTALLGIVVSMVNVRTARADDGAGGWDDDDPPKPSRPAQPTVRPSVGPRLRPNLLPRYRTMEDVRPEPEPEPAATPPLSDKELEELIAEAWRTKSRESADLVLDEIRKAIEAKRAAGEQQDAAELISPAVRIARAAKSDRYYDFQALGKRLLEESRNNKTVQKLQARLEREPDSRAIRERLIRMYLVHLNDVAKAAELLKGDDSVSEELRTVALCAGKPVETLTPDELFCLGEWFCQNADDEPIALLRAKVFLDQYMEVAKTKDADYLKAQRLQRSAVKDLRKDIVTVGPPVFRDMVDAAQSWQATRRLKPGRHVVIRAAGTWYGGIGRMWKSTPDGCLDRERSDMYHLEGALGNGEAFRVGSFSHIKPGNGGVLYLRMNDDLGRISNSGEVAVLVYEVQIDKAAPSAAPKKDDANTSP